MTTPADLQESRQPAPLEIAPGFFTEGTPRTVANHWKHGDKVRFRNGLAQKMGGWIEQELTGYAHYGVPRTMWEWVSNDGESWVAEGTSQKLYLFNRGIRYDITPVAASGVLLTDPFAVVDTFTTVTVTHAAHGRSVGDFVRFSGATAGGGITINGEYQVTTTPTANTYTIEHSAPATSTDATTGGAAVAFSYDISIGAESNQAAVGYGTGPYGDGLYGTPRVGAASTIFSALRIWSLDNFGEDLIASPTGGAVYHWDKTNGTSTRAVLLPDAPATNQHVLISSSGGRIVCLGAFDPVAAASDPLNIIAGGEESFTDFEVVDETSDVFTDRVASGSKLVGGLRTAGCLLIWTDLSVFQMLPDPTEIYQLRTVSDTNAFCGPNAALDINGTVIGMATDKFMGFDGVYSELPCTVWGWVFDNKGSDDVDFESPGFNATQAAKVVAWHNKPFSEVWWFYPEKDEEENSRAVIFNYSERLWYYVEMSRTAALAPGAMFKVPVAVEADGDVFLHETGTTDDGAAMEEFIESYDIQMGDGALTTAVSRIIPDMKRQIGTLMLTLGMKTWPHESDYTTKGPYTFTATTPFIDPRAKGRMISLKLHSDSTDADWRLGRFDLYGQPDAERA